MALFNCQMEIGTELPPISKQLSIDMFKSGDVKTIHNDMEAAQREGLPAPIAVGPQVAALIFRMMSISFEEGWYVGGKASITFRRPVFCHEFVTAKGVVKERVDEDNKTRVVCDVWVENLKGEKAIVGTCSALIEKSD